MCFHDIRFNTLDADSWPSLQFGRALLHISLSSSFSATRRAALASLKFLTGRIPRLIHHVMRDAIKARLSHPVPAVLVSDDVSSISGYERLPAVLLALSSFAESTESTLREDLLTEAVILAHHGDVGAWPYK